MSDQRETVVVTGGSGFLGQHIVCALLEQTNFPIKEIRIFDLKPIQWFSGLKAKTESIPVWFAKGDIMNVDDIDETFRGATVVIHNASLVDVTTSPDEARMDRINIQGTADVIQSCVSNNIPILIYTSSVDAVHDGIMGAYGESKRVAERLVLQANNSNLPNGKRMLTCALRPVVMFGEGDPNILMNVKPVAQSKLFFRLGGDKSSTFQLAYAGNVAHCFVLAISRLLRANELDESHTPAGKAIGITDDTPVQSFNKQLQPYVESLGGRMTSYYIPFIILKILATLCEMFVWLMRPVHRFRFLLTRDCVWYLQHSPVLTDKDAKQFLGYQPVFTYVKALQRSIHYLKEQIKK